MDIEEIFKSFDECVKDLIVIVIIVGMKLLERIIINDDYFIIMVCFLVFNVVVFVKVLFEMFYGVKIGEENEDWEDFFKDIFKCFVIFVRDIV